MGKTRRGGTDGGRISSEVEIKVIGAQVIVPIPFTAVARRDQTWYAFLAENGLKLTSKDGIYVRTTHFRDASRANNWHGFGAELNEKVGTFLGKFKLNKKQYTVRLMRRIPVINFKPPSKVVRRQQNRRPGGAGGSGLGKGVAWNLRSSMWVAGGGGVGVSREAKLASRQFEGRLDEEEEEDGGARGPVGDADAGATKNGLEEIPLQQEEVEGEMEDDDNMSVLTSDSQDARDLRGQGIPNEDLKNLASRELDGIENGYLLRARQELRKLKENNLWMRSYQKAPLAFYLLEQVLKP